MRPNKGLSCKTMIESRYGIWEDNSQKNKRAQDRAKKSRTFWYQLNQSSIRHNYRNHKGRLESILHRLSLNPMFNLNTSNLLLNQMLMIIILRDLNNWMRKITTTCKMKDQSHRANISINKMIWKERKSDSKSQNSTRTWITTLIIKTLSITKVDKNLLESLMVKDYFLNVARKDRDIFLMSKKSLLDMLSSKTM